jgi:hypothetical protein
MQPSISPLSVPELMDFQTSFWVLYRSGNLREKDIRYFWWFMGLTPEQRDFLIQDNEVPVLRPDDVSPILECVFYDQEILIPATDGTRLVRDAAALFPSFLQVQLKHFNVQKSDPRPAARVRIHRLLSNVTAWEALRSLGTKKSKLALTQNQVIAFCESRPEWMEGCSTFFLVFDQREMYIFEIRKHGKVFGIDSYDGWILTDPSSRLVTLDVVS